MPNLPDLTAQLQSVEHFRNLPDADIRAIISAGRVRRFAVDETIFAESEPCAGMFVLLQGQVHLRKLEPQGQESILAIVEPVIMFNEVPVLDGGTNLATAWPSPTVSRGRSAARRSRRCSSAIRRSGWGCCGCSPAATVSWSLNTRIFPSARCRRGRPSCCSI